MTKPINIYGRDGARFENLGQRRFSCAFSKTREIVDRSLDLSLFKTRFRGQARNSASMPGDDDCFAALHGGQQFRKAGLRVGGLHFSHEENIRLVKQTSQYGVDLVTGSLSYWLRCARMTLPPKLLVFDSGLGGLTVFAEIVKLRPHGVVLRG